MAEYWINLLVMAALPKRLIDQTNSGPFLFISIFKDICTYIYNGRGILYMEINCMHRISIKLERSLI